MHPKALGQLQLRNWPLEKLSAKSSSYDNKHFKNT